MMSLQARCSGRRLCSRPAFALALLAFSAPSEATEYAFEQRWRWAHFTISDGLPSNRITEIVEARDGTTWVSTSSGLAWFDGWHWRAMGPGEGLPRGIPTDLAAAEESGVLAIIDGKLYRGDRRGFQHVTLDIDDSEYRVRDAVPFPGGGLAILLRTARTGRGSLFRLESEDTGKLIALQGPRAGEAVNLWLASPDDPWIDTTVGLYRWDGGSWRRQRTTAQRPAGLSCLQLADGSGWLSVGLPRGNRSLRVWTTRAQPLPPFGTPHARLVALDVSSAGVVAATDDSGTVYLRGGDTWSEVDPVPQQFTDVECLQFRSGGDLWVGTDHGLYLYRSSSTLWDHWENPAPGSSNRVHEVLEAHDGSVWIASDEGVEVHLPDGSVRRIGKVHGTTIRSTGVAQDASRSIWITSGSAYEGAYRFDGAEWTYFGPERGLHGFQHKVRIDRRGRPWFLGLNRSDDMELTHGTGASVYDDGGFTHWTTAEGLIHDRVFAFAEGLEGEFWFGTLGGLSRWKDGRWTHWTDVDGLADTRIWTLAVDENNQVWFGDELNGLGTIDGETPRYFTVDDGLLANEVQDVRADPCGGIWYSCHGGVGRFTDGRWYAIPSGCGIGHSGLWPVLATRERVFIGTLGAGTAVLNRAALEDVSLDVLSTGHSIHGGLAAIRWHAAARDALVPPEEIETRYRLNEEPWSDWLLGHSATVEISPGSHIFTVEARSRLAESPTTGARIALAVPFPVYRHPGVVSAAVVLLMVIAWLSASVLVRKRRHYLALRESETRFRTMADHAPVMIWMSSADGRVTYFSKPWLAFTGRTMERETFLGWLDDVHPEDKQPCRSAYDAAFGAREAFETECRLRRHDGEYRWLLCIGVPRFAPDEGFAGYIGSCIDITERKAAEEDLKEARQRLNHVLSSCPAVVYSCGAAPEHPTTYISENVRSMLGHDPEEYLEDPYFWEKRIHPEDRDHVLGQLRNIERGVTVSYEYRYRRADGQYVWLHDQLVPVHETDGAVKELIGSWFDITKRKQAEERARLLSEAVEQCTEGVAISDLSGALLYTNQACALMHGYGPEALSGKHLSIFHTPQQMPTVDASIRRMVEKGSFDGEIWHARKDGAVFPTLMRNALLRDERGVPVGLVAAMRDVTDLKEAEEQLKASERRYRELYEGSRDGYALVEMDGRIVQCNTSFTKMVGYSKRELLQMTYEDLTPASWHACEARILHQQVLTRGYSDVYEKEYRHKDGTLLPVELRTHLLRDEAGNAIGMWAFVRDISERKRAEESLRASEERFRQLAEHIDQVFWMCSPDWNQVLYVSPAYENVWGRSRESLYAKPRSWLSLVHEADREQVLAAIEAKSHGGFSKREFPEYRVVRDDGSVRWVSARSFPVRNDRGEVYRIAGIAEDITDRRRVQEALARTTATLNNILSSSTEYAIAATDLDLRVIHYNPAAERMFGLPADQVMGRRIESIHEKAGVDPERVPAALERVTHDGKWEAELRRTGLDGKERFILPVVTPMRDETGAMIGYVLLARDVTEQRQAEAARGRLESQLRQVHKLQAVGQLAAGVAHDFNTVLAVILGNAELLQNECHRRRLRDPNESISGSLKLIVNSVERGQKLVQNLMTFGRARSWSPRPINLNRRVDQVRRILGDVLGSDVNLKVRKEASLRAVNADAGQIEQVLVNLLLNARDAMPDGGELIIETANVDLDEAYAAAHAEAQPGPHVVLAVSDTGVGMDHPTLERLFEPFFTTKRVGQGTGLGLSIVYAIVKQAGGHITVTSNLGKGTTFSIYLPAIE